MRVWLVLLALVLAASGCDPKDATVTVPSRSSERREENLKRNPAAGKELTAYAPATDFTGAAPEDAANGASAFFDGTRMRDAVSGAQPGALGAQRGKRIVYTAAESERRRAGGVEPPLPDDYDYSRSGATPGSARGAGEALLGFARFQIEQKFPTVAPIMSRFGWNAAPRTGSNQRQNPYRVTVHHTQGKHAMNEHEAVASVKGTQHYHMVGRAREGKEAFSDIGYHFLIAGDGRVVEGRHAEYLGAHAGGSNTGNIGVAMMGDFNKIKPTNAQIESLTRLVTFLSLKYKKDPAAKGFLEPHLHYTNTDCPGKNMMAILDSLRRVIDKEHDEIIAGSGEFVPLAVKNA